MSKCVLGLSTHRVRPASLHVFVCLLNNLTDCKGHKDHFIPGSKAGSSLGIRREVRNSPFILGGALNEELISGCPQPLTLPLVRKLALRMK